MNELNIIEYEDIIRNDTGRIDKVVGQEDFKKLLDTLELMNNNIETIKKLEICRPNGILFIGPPGTGKTLMLMAAAEKLKYAVLPVHGDIINTAPMNAIKIKKIKQAFDLARGYGKNIIIFFDELDGLVGSRDNSVTSVGESGGLLQALLQILDGVENLDDDGEIKHPLDKPHILVIGCTNNPEKLDTALVRPGRFDEKVYFDLPGELQRYEFLNKFLASKYENIDLESIVDLTDGLSYAELNGFTNIAKRDSFYNNKPLDNSSILNAIQAVSIGSNSSSISPNKKLIKHLIPHCVGHTIAYMFSPQLFCLGSVKDSACVVCRPKIKKDKIYTRRETITNIISIIWAQINELEETGETSSLYISDNQMLDDLLKQALTMMGAEQSPNLNLNKLKTSLLIVITTFVKELNNNESFKSLKEKIKNIYKSTNILTRKDLKNCVGSSGFTQDLIDSIYNKLLDLIANSLKLNVGLSSVTTRNENIS